MTSEFEKTLGLYQKNLTEYKVSGNAAYKVAADTTKKWLDDYIKTMEERTEKSKKEIQDFVESYAKSDTELATLKKDMAEIRKKGPELQIQYETENNAQKEEEAETDFTIYYTKGAVLAGVIGLVTVASFI
jgi:chromosome segregation ATPase